MAWCFAITHNGNHAVKHCQALPTNGWEDLVGHLRKNGQGRKVSFSAMPKAGFPTFHLIPGGQHHHAIVHVALAGANVQASCQAAQPVAIFAGIATGMGLPVVWL